MSYRVKSFDLESTGKDPATARIWQVATDTREWFVNPQAEIPAEVVELCHITPAMMAEIQWSPTWDQLEADVMAELCDCDALVTQNGVKYDVPVLTNAYHVGGSCSLPSLIDVKILAFEAWTDIGSHTVGEVELSGHKLANVGLHLGLTTAEDIIANAHNALWDCRLALAVFNALPSKWTADLDRLMAFQARAMAMQERDWELYGVTPEDGPQFLWFRTCRKCMGSGDYVPHAAMDNIEPELCKACMGMGILHHTKKRRGQVVDPRFLRFVRGLNSCPKAFRTE
jgi:DNA polymerase III epsilon subunit-like protein